MLKNSKLLNEQAPPPTRTGSSGPQQPDATGQGPQPPVTGGQQSSAYACIEAVHPTGRSYTSDKGQLHIVRAGGSKHVFFSNNTFVYLKDTTKLVGSWSCDGASGYKMTLRNGQTYSSKDGKWTSIPPQPTPPPTTPPQPTPPPTTPPQPTPPPTQGGATSSGVTIIKKDDKNFAVAGSDAIIY